MLYVWYSLHRYQVPEYVPRRLLSTRLMACMHTYKKKKGRHGNFMDSLALSLFLSLSQNLQLGHSSFSDFYSFLDERVFHNFLFARPTTVGPYSTCNFTFPKQYKNYDLQNSVTGQFITAAKFPEFSYINWLILHF